MTGVIVKKFAFSVGNSILPICLKRYNPSKGISMLKHLIQHPNNLYLVSLEDTWIGCSKITITPTTYNNPECFRNWRISKFFV